MLIKEQGMSEEREQAISEASKLVFDCVSNMQRTIMQDWQKLSMSMAQVKVLLLLSFKGPVAISKLAKTLDVSHPTASQLVDRLVQAGHVERVESAIDRRFTLASLTEDGEQLARHLWQGRMSHLRSSLTQLDEQDLAALRQGLCALNRITASLSTDVPTKDRPLEEGS